MKITSFNKDVENISKLSDRPNIENGYTPNALKALFDKAGVDIKDYINSVLIGELTSTEENASGADRIGSAYIEALPGDTVQEKLTTLSSQVKDIANGAIPDGTVTPEKFAPDIASFLTSASIRAELFKNAEKSTFVVSRGGVYKFTLVGGGAGGGIQPTDSLKMLGGGGGASVILWRELNAGDVCELTVGAGGKGMQVEGTSLVSSAQGGGDTTLSINGVTIATAGGGVFGLETSAVATGGDINRRGGYPKSGGIKNTTGSAIEYTMGGDSLLGCGASYTTDVPGIGGGGFAGRYLGSGIYYCGYDGGNGFAMVEYLK